MRNMFIFILFLTIWTFRGQDKLTIQAEISALELFEQAIVKMREDQDTSLSTFRSIVNGEIKSGDTLKMKAAFWASSILSKQQNFDDAFFNVRKALYMAESLKDTTVLSLSNMLIGKLYGEFGKEELSYKHISNYLRFNKYLFKKGKISEHKVAAAHFDLGMHYRTFKKYNLALTHLDTCSVLCESYKAPILSQSFHKAEQACIYKELGQVKKAKNILNDIEKHFDRESKFGNKKVGHAISSYMSMVYLYKGDVLLKEEDFTNACVYYKRSIENILRYKQYLNLLPKAYEGLSKSQFKTGELKSAYRNIVKAKDLNDDSYNLNSKKNNSLIQIKNEYQEEIEKQKKLLDEEHKHNLVFRIVIIVLFSILVIGFLLFRSYLQKNKYLSEKQVYEEKQKESSLKLETKNKELTGYTLKLIEKEEIIDDLTQKLKEISGNDKTVKTMLNGLKVRSESLWEDFNTRFVEVNEDFYQRLSEKYPELSVTERKHCALIKLNFSGKDMAQLLGISVQSVHVSRYRLRKKFGVKKGENLTEFISKI